MRKKTTWIVAKDMVNAKEVVHHLKKIRLKLPLKRNVGIDEDINFL